MPFCIAGRTWSRSGAVIDWAAPEVRVLKRRGHVGLVESADVIAWRDDLVDPVKDLVAERDIEAASRSSRCPMVRGPTMALVTPG
jgi:hypothetical protein